MAWPKSGLLACHEYLKINKYNNKIICKRAPTACRGLFGTLLIQTTVKNSH